MNERETALLAKLEQHSCKATIIPSHLLNQLQQEMKELFYSGILDNNLIHKYLNNFQFDYSLVLPNAQSIIVIAVPQPITILSFTWRKNEQKIIIPPTYVYTEAEKLVFSIAESELKKENYSIIYGKLPLKILAVKSGLSQYGRNNISYIPGMGSFYRLTALISDMPSETIAWQGVQMMSHCNHCFACSNSCPTKCINRNKTIIDASHCLTYINESSEPFPDWINCNWHNAIVGCMRCQLACPQNQYHKIIRDFKDNLTEDDIAVLLNEDDFIKLLKKTRNFLIELNLNDYEIPILQRNLKALLTY